MYAVKNAGTTRDDMVFIGAEPATVQKLITSVMRSNPTALVGSAGTARIKQHRMIAGATRMSRRGKIPKDDELIELIEEAFHGDERVSLEPINVSVKNGVVTLNGTVGTHRRKLAAQEIASSFEGCRDVVNKLTVDPETPPPDREVAKKVKCSLNASADVTADVVNATVTNGSVSLSGAVRSAWERLVAEDVARSARGVRDVENLLVVDPWPRSTMGK
jgi:osmotically-inducible protein OsmY